MAILDNDLAWYQLDSRIRSGSEFRPERDDEDEPELDDERREHEDQIAGMVTKIVDSFKEHSGEWRRSRFCRELSLFEGRDLNGYSGSAYVDSAAWTLDRHGLIRSMVLHAVADVYAPLQPKPQFQTTGATWDLKRRALRMQRNAEGIITSPAGQFVNVWEFTLDAATDAAIHGIAPIHVDYDDDTERVEHRLFCWPDVFFDPREKRDPQNMFWREAVPCEKAHEKWGEEACQSAKRYEHDYPNQSTEHDVIERAVDEYEIYHAIKLPRGKGMSGRHVAVLGGVTVIDEDWDSPAFPFVFAVWEWTREAFDGIGIAAEAEELAISQGELSTRMNARARIASKQIVAYEEEAIDPATLERNDECVLVSYRKGSAPPTIQNAVPFTPTDMEFAESEKRAAWDKVGLSQISAAARREPGLTSGVAQITLNQTKQGRQLPKAQRHENIFVAYGQQYNYALRRAKKRNKQVKITWAGRNVLREFLFADADVGDNPLRVSVDKASSLPRDPAGRQQVVQSMSEAGLLTPEQARRLMQWPDLEAELSIETAETEYLDMLIDRYLDAEEGKWSAADWEPPEAFIADKVGAIKRFAAAWFRARIDQASLPKEERKAAELPIKLLADYIKLLAKALQPPPAPAPQAVLPAPAVATPQVLPGGAAPAPAPIAPAVAPPPIAA